MRGHITRRGKVWSIVIDLPRRPDGKRRQQWHTVHGTKADAERTLRRLLRELDEGTWRDDRMTVGEFADEWLHTIAASVAESTHRSYSGHLAAHVIPAVGSVPLVKLTPQQLSRYYAGLVVPPVPDGLTLQERRGRSTSTVHRIHATVRKMLADAVRWDLLVRNLANAATLPKATDRRAAIHVWEPDDLAKFLAVARTTRWWPCWALLATTGIRRSEALGLTWDDIDLAQETISIVRQRRPEGARELKTSSSRRTIAISPALADVLRDWRRTTLEERLLIGTAWHDEGWIFVWPDGRAPHPDMLTKWFGKLRAKADIPRIRLHDLRHTHATNLLRHGLDTKIVADRLGHSTTILTRDTYQHLVPELDRRAATITGEVLGLAAADPPIRPSRRKGIAND